MGTPVSIDRSQIEDEVDRILNAVPRDEYTLEETVALAALPRPVHDRYLNDRRPPARVLKFRTGLPKQQA